jgi:antitoxin VapB
MVEWWKVLVERWKAMALNIKDEETHQLASKLAKLTGESLTLAVKISVMERLERQKPNPKAGLADWLDELTKRTAPLMKDLPPSTEIGDLLYDKETGLPL